MHDHPSSTPAPIDPYAILPKCKVCLAPFLLLPEIDDAWVTVRTKRSCMGALLYAMSIVLIVYLAVFLLFCLIPGISRELKVAVFVFIMMIGVIVNSISYFKISAFHKADRSNSPWIRLPRHDAQFRLHFRSARAIIPHHRVLTHRRISIVYSTRDGEFVEGMVYVGRPSAMRKFESSSLALEPQCADSSFEIVDVDTATVWGRLPDFLR